MLIENTDSKIEPGKRLMLGIPMTGLLRSEWVMARYGQMIPVNWGHVEYGWYLDQCSPLRFMVADARNIIATKAVEGDFEWLFFVDHDTILPPNTILTWNHRMLEGKIPVWSGLYFTKSVPSEPLVFRGRGNGFYNKWKLGDLVWVDGIPMGCTMIHVSILKALYEESEEYSISGGKVRRMFVTPSESYYDPEKKAWSNMTGTEDLHWCSRIMRDGIFEKAGWPEYQNKEYPFLIDTNIFCKHIDFNGIQYPSKGEEKAFQ